jgi:hypothetical protein
MSTATHKKARAKLKFTPGSRRTRVGSARKPTDPFAALIDDLCKIGASVPDKEWAKLPPDFNENLDHYLYGSPKKSSRHE